MIKKFFIAILVLLMIGAGVGAWLYYGFKTSNPLGYKSVGEISVPIGYKRINQDDGFAKYLRELPLKKTGSKVQLFTGGDFTYKAQELRRW